jgi:hypothetical protein
MNWNDLFRGIAYFKDMAYLPIYKRVASELNIPRFPLAIAHADVCRHDLFSRLKLTLCRFVLHKAKEIMDNVSVSVFK